MRGQITLKSGVQITFPIVSITIQRNRVTSELAGIKWATPAGTDAGLSYIDLSEVVAVVTLDD